MFFLLQEELLACLCLLELFSPLNGLKKMQKQQKRITLRHLIIVQGGLITSTGVVLVVLVLVFVVLGVVLVVIPVVAGHYCY